MQCKSNNDLENILRMKEIADIYNATGQYGKSERYHKGIIEICEKHPKNEMMLMLKINSLNYLKKTYKSLETTNELLSLNPYNIDALINIANHINKTEHV